MEPTSTDKRIDDLSDRAGRFEGNVDRRFDRFERSVDERFDKVDRRFERFEDKMDARFDRIDARFDRWGRILIGGVVSIAGAVILKILGV